MVKPTLQTRLSTALSGIAASLGLLGVASASLQPAQESLPTPEQTALEMRVQAARSALSRSGDAAASPLAKHGVSRVAQWFNWPNWNNWGNWNNWRNFGNWHN